MFSQSPNQSSCMSNETSPTKSTADIVAKYFSFVFLFPLADAHFVFQVQIFEYNLKIWLILTENTTDTVENQHPWKIQIRYIAH